MKVAHLTSVHSRFDTRVYLKECRSLANHGYHVALVVADGNGNAFCDGIEVHDVGAPLNRWDRMRRTPDRIFQKARRLDCEIYHLHDPELIPIGLRLRREGKIVVFDAHEDVPKQLLTKPYLHPFVRSPLSRLFAGYERMICRKFSSIVAATPSIREKYLRLGADCIVVNNYPIEGELAPRVIDWTKKKSVVCYIGGMTRIRGIIEAIQAMQLVSSRTRLALGGLFSGVGLEAEAKELPGWGRVDFLGFVDRAGVSQTLAESVAGLVTFLPAPNHIDAQPNKMFEYMSAGVPVIASDFPLWKQIIEGNQCGICVDPTSPLEIAEAIDHLVAHPEEAERMGRNGQRAITQRYNWRIEEKSLLELYERLVKRCD